MVSAVLSLFGSAYDHACRGRTTGLILPIVLFDVVVDVLIGLIVLATPDLCSGCPSNCASGCSANSSPYWNWTCCGVLRIGLGVTGAYVCLDGFRSLALAWNDCFSECNRVCEQDEQGQEVG